MLPRRLLWTLAFGLPLLAIGAVGFLQLPVASVWSADGFDPTGRTRPSWADSGQAIESPSFHMVRHSMSWGASRWLTTETFAVVDGGSIQAGAGETRDAAGNVLRLLYVGPEGSWGVSPGGSCELIEPDAARRSLTPGRPDPEGMIASGYADSEVVAPASPRLSAALLEASLAPERRLTAAFTGPDGTRKTRDVQLDGEGWVVRYHGATYDPAGQLLGERLELVQTIKTRDSVEGAIDSIRHEVQATCA